MNIQYVNEKEADKILKQWINEASPVNGLGRQIWNFAKGLTMPNARKGFTQGYKDTEAMLKKQEAEKQRKLNSQIQIIIPCLPQSKNSFVVGALANGNTTVDGTKAIIAIDNNLQIGDFNSLSVLPVIKIKKVNKDNSCIGKIVKPAKPFKFGKYNLVAVQL